jgi:hypothetical protein
LWYSEVNVCEAARFGEVDIREVAWFALCGSNSLRTYHPHVTLSYQ